MTKIYKSFEQYSEYLRQIGWRISIRESDIAQGSWNACAVSKDAELAETRKTAVKLIKRLHKKYCNTLKTNREKDAEIERFKKAYIKIKSAYSFKCQCDFLTETTGICGECEIMTMIEKELNQGKKDE